jgi:O-antigen/teichoic acid export membrane protein
MFVSLYTVRVVLNTLGAQDYGIYSVVAGIVSFFSFLSGTMASATQRFFSFALGQNDTVKLNKTFSVNLFVFIAIAILAFVLLETVGVWFINEYLQVPEERFEVAKVVYQYSVFMFITTIVSTPFMAIIIAHEDMQLYTYISIIEVILKLGVVFLLLYISFDKLELYGSLTFFVSLFVTTIYVVVCLFKYSECQFRKFYWDRSLLKQIIGFTGWTLFGQLSSVGRNQAVTILLNQFFNPVVVAARAIAVNITNNIGVFANNFNTGLYPPIIKSYASNNKMEMFSLIINGSKISFILMWVFLLPMFLEMEIILKLWLKNPPEYAVLFTRLALIEVAINSISLPIATAARAPGKMKVYELSLGFIQIVIFAASWILLKYGAQAQIVFVVAIVANIIMFVVRLLLVRNLLNFRLEPYLSQVLLPVLLVIVLSAISSYLVNLFLPRGVLFSCLVMCFSMFSSLMCMYYVGLNDIMRVRIIDLIMTKLKSFLK